MAQPNDDIDEVALNVLLAEGLDVPTALEASRYDSGDEPGESGCFASLILLVVTLLIAVAVSAAAAIRESCVSIACQRDSATTLATANRCVTM